MKIPFLYKDKHKDPNIPKKNLSRKSKYSFTDCLQNCCSDFSFPQYMDLETKDYPLDDFNNKTLF